MTKQTNCRRGYDSNEEGVEEEDSDGIQVERRTMDLIA
jgi:hypothetical protein